MAERDERGRLQPGHAGIPGSGRKPKAISERALSALESVTDDETMLKLCHVLIDNAMQGKYRYVELTFGYLLGKPVARVERVGGNAIEEAMAKWKEMQAQSEQQEIEQMYGEPTT